MERSTRRDYSRVLLFVFRTYSLAGKEVSNSVCLRELLAEIVPQWSSVMLLAIASPKPLPPVSLERDLSTR